MIKFELDKLNTLLKDFHNLTHIKVCVFDQDLIEIASYPQSNSDLCQLVKTTSKGMSMCQHSDKIAFDTCKKRKSHYIFQCPFGFTEAVTPIVINDIIAGYIMLGKVMIENDVSCVNRVLENSTLLNLDIDDVKKRLTHIVPTSMDNLMSASHILDTCASYLYLSKHVNVVGDDIIHNINSYIKKNIKYKLNIEILCNEFLISRVSLYSLFRENFQSTVAEYIKEYRIKTAKDLLSTTTLQISEIADAIGQDYNYFSKIFTKTVGVSPKKYRDNNRIKTKI